jgi:hypothetical protein
MVSCNDSITCQTFNVVKVSRKVSSLPAFILFTMLCTLAVIAGSFIVNVVRERRVVKKYASETSLSRARDALALHCLYASCIIFARSCHVAGCSSETGCLDAVRDFDVAIGAKGGVWDVLDIFVSVSLPVASLGNMSAWHLSSYGTR